MFRTSASEAFKWRINRIDRLMLCSFFLGHISGEYRLVPNGIRYGGMAFLLSYSWIGGFWNEECAMKLYLNVASTIYISHNWSVSRACTNDALAALRIVLFHILEIEFSSGWWATVFVCSVSLCVRIIHILLDRNYFTLSEWYRDTLRSVWFCICWSVFITAFGT